MLEFFTATVESSVLTILIVGLLMAGITFFSEVVSIYQRVRWLLNKAERHNFTWRTALWLPVRVYVVILIPQIFYIFFTQIVKFG